MKRLFLIFTATLLCAVSFAQSETTSKTGVMLASEHKIVVEARRSAMHFNKIEASRAIRVIVEERTTGNIIVRAPQSVIPYVSLSVKDNTLKATILSGAPVSRRSNIIAEVYVPYNGMIEEIVTSSAARVIVKPSIMCGELDLEASSASVIEVKSGAREVSIEASGASTVRAEVAAGELDVDITGASELHLSGMAAESEVDIAGAAILHAEKLNVTTLDLECLGASKALVKAEFCTVEASGASAVEVECSQMLNISVGGASSVVYDGACQVNTISNRGASTIRKK